MSHQYNTRHKRRSKQPHASLYVGYVEDVETIESIMKKFEVMETMKKTKKDKAASRKAKHASSNANSKKAKASSKAEISDSENEEEEEDIDLDGNNDGKENESSQDDEALDQEDLARLFTETSLYSVSSVLKNNEIFAERPIVDKDGFVTGFEDTLHNSELILAADYQGVNDDLQYDPNESDAGDESDFFNDVMETARAEREDRELLRRGSGRRARGKGAGGVRNVPRKHNLASEDIDKHYAYTYGRRLAPLVAGDAERRARALKMRTCSALYKVNIPKYPMPLSWGNRVKRFNGHVDTIGTDIERAKRELMAFDYIMHDDLTQLKASDLPHGKFHGVLIDCPFDVSCSLFNPRAGMVDYTKLRKLPIADIVENGMLFVWIPSELLVEVVKMIELEWGFRYVEHATFGKKGLNNQFLIKRGQLINYSKENLLLFRKGTKKHFVGKVELRHQRTSDTHLNFIRFHKKYTKMEMKPYEFAYRMIETMLPDATQHIRDAIREKTDLSKVESRLLYLWAPENEHRGAWTMMVDKKHCQYLQRIEDDPNHQAGYCGHQSYYQVIKDKQKQKKNKATRADTTQTVVMTVAQ